MIIDSCDLAQSQEPDVWAGHKHKPNPGLSVALAVPIHPGNYRWAAGLHLWAPAGLGSISLLFPCFSLAVQVAMVLLFEALFQNPLETHHTLRLLLGSGLDVCGLRLLYPGQELLLSSSGGLCLSSRASQICKCTEVKVTRVRFARGLLYQFLYLSQKKW